jgi:cathepsin X
MTQQVPSVCGSCWAEAATGALSDRYNIATGNKLRVQLAPQNLLNFKEKITGGGCTGGDSLKAYEFFHNYGVSDDTCATFVGVDYARGFVVAGMTKKDEVQAHMCYMCDWDGKCLFLPRDQYHLYGVDEYGTVTGVQEMKAEIFARGPISCSINSEANSFDIYKGGIIRCDDPADTECKTKGTDHVIVIAGWGVDAATGDEYWIGRNSYGTRWGEGAGGGWFRMLLGHDILSMESHQCTWGVPAKADVQRAVNQFQNSK